MARLSAYRDTGSYGDPYPPWMDATRGANGVYAIRCKGELVYIGESHSGKLYETLTRHLQRWKLDEAHAYRRSDCEVAIAITTAAEAPPLQAHWICELQPRDNVYEVCEEIPF